MPRKKAPKLKVIEKKLGRERALGLCYQNALLVEIDPRQTHRGYLLTLIHECLHAAFPHLTEGETTKAERLIGATLWEQGYRKTML